MAEMVNKDDDDEEALVQQVLAESPVDERGVRDEWVQQVGWHRKEHVGLLRAGAGAARQQQDWKATETSGKQSISNDKVDPTQNNSGIQPASSVVSVLIVALVLFLLRFVLGFYSRRKHRPSVRFNYTI